MRRVSMLRRLQWFVESPGGAGFALAAAGFAVWMTLSIVAGLATSEPGFRLREAWDTDTYFFVGVPVMALAVAAAAFRHPERIWRWPLWLVAGHQVGVLLVGLGMQSGASLFVLTLMMGALLVVFFAVPAFVGAEAARRMGERAY